MATNKLGIDPKKFKFLKSDDKSTTLQHNDGHLLTIAHSVLPKEHQEQLKAMGSSNKEPEEHTYGEVKVKEADGGEIKGIHPSFQKSGESLAGDYARKAKTGGKDSFASSEVAKDTNNRLAKSLHSQTLDQLKHMSKPNLPMAKGGDVKLDWREMGVHNQSAQEGNGVSIAGRDLRLGDTDSAKKSHQNRLEQMKNMPNPKLKGLAEGGVIGAGEIGSAKEAADKDGANQYAYQHQLPCLNPQCKSHGRPHPNCRCYGGGGEWGRFAQGGKAKSFCSESRQHDSDCEYYADGGKTDSSTGLSEDQAKGLSQGASEGNTTSASEAWQNIKNEVGNVFGASKSDQPQPNKARGGKIQHYADGTPDGGASDSSDDSDKHRIAAKMISTYLDDQHEPTPGSGVLQTPDPSPPSSLIQPNQSNSPAGNGASGSWDAASPAPASVPDAASAPASVPNPSGSMPTSEPSPESDNSNPDVQGVSKKDTGNMPEYDAATAPPNPNLGEEAKQHALDFQDDLKNGHITPKTFESLMFDGKGVLGKIGTIFGLMIGGAGAGLAHQQPALIGLMQKEIDNDIAAQSKSKDNAQNLLRMNQQYIKNKADVGYTNQQKNALAITNAQNNATSGAFQHLVNINSKLPVGSPQRQRGDQMLAPLYSMVQGKIQNSAAALAGMQALGNSISPDQSGGSSQSAADQNSPIDEQGLRQNRLNSQLGIIGAPSAGQLDKMENEAGKLKTLRSFRNNFNNSYDELNNMFLKGKLSPNLYEAYKTNLAGEYRKSTGAGDEAAKQEISNMLPKYNDLGKTDNKRRSLNNKNFDTLEAGSAPTLQSFKLWRPANTQPQSAQSNQFKEGQISKEKSTGKATVFRNGRWEYQ